MEDKIVKRIQQLAWNPIYWFEGFWTGLVVRSGRCSRQVISELLQTEFIAQSERAAGTASRV